MVEPTSANGNMSPQAERKKLIEVNHLVKYFPVRAGLMQRVKAWVKAVDDVSFFINEGETFGLVGESGCGKTTVGKAILQLIQPTGGSVVLVCKTASTYKWISLPLRTPVAWCHW